MKSYMHNGTTVIAVQTSQIGELLDKILNELETKEVFQSQTIFRSALKGDLSTILRYGTDRWKERSFEEYDEANRLLGKGQEIIRCCQECRSKYEFKDVVRAINFLGEKKLLIDCPFQGKTKVDNRYLVHNECPTYMIVAGGPNVFFGEELEREAVRKQLSIVRRGSYLLLYDADKVEPFDLERFAFKDGISPNQALKCVIEAR